VTRYHSQNNLIENTKRIREFCKKVVADLFKATRQALSCFRKRKIFSPKCSEGDLAPRYKLHSYTMRLWISSLNRNQPVRSCLGHTGCSFKSSNCRTIPSLRALHGEATPTLEQPRCRSTSRRRAYSPSTSRPYKTSPSINGPPSFAFAFE
jgi:hypothetical protein